MCGGVTNPDTVPPYLVNGGGGAPRPPCLSSLSPRRCAGELSPRLRCPVALYSLGGSTQDTASAARDTQVTAQGAWQLGQAGARRRVAAAAAAVNGWTAGLMCGGGGSGGAWYVMALVDEVVLSGIGLDSSAGWWCRRVPCVVAAAAKPASLPRRATAGCARRVRTRSY